MELFEPEQPNLDTNLICADKGNTDLRIWISSLLPPMFKKRVG